MPPPCSNARRQQAQQPFDVTLLCTKLEDHRRKLDTGRSRPQQRNAIPEPSYVPQNAANQFAATTTPVRREQGAQAKRSSTTSWPKSTFMADGKPCVNPKQLRAALSIGMSEAEMLATGSNDPVHQSIPPDDARSPPKERSRSRTRCSAENPVSQPSNAEKPMRSYKPGDAARRRVQYVAVKHGSMTAYERVEVPGLPASQGLDALIEDAEQHDLHRPTLHAYDRPNWAQASQCGDDMRRVLDFPLRRKHHHAVPEEDVPNFTACVGAEMYEGRPQLTRHKSENDAPVNLVNDAVAAIKREEKAKRRQSMLGFLKRH